MTTGMSAGGTEVDQQDHASRLQGGFQREEVDATQRALEGGAASNTVDEAGVAISTAAAAQLVEAFPESVTGWSTWRSEVTVDVRRSDVALVATYLRDELGFALLSDISPCDRLGSAHAHPARFSVAYHVTKLVPGAPRLRLQVWTELDEAVPSVMEVWPTADWHEREAYDFFGIEFTGRAGLRRLIMDDDWVGHPLRKDYPIGGEPVKFTNAVREI